MFSLMDICLMKSLVFSPISLVSKYGTSSFWRMESYLKGNFSAYSSTKKSKGLITCNLAITSTSMRSSVVFSGKTTLAW